MWNIFWNREDLTTVDTENTEFLKGFSENCSSKMPVLLIFLMGRGATAEGGGERF